MTPTSHEPTRQSVNDVLSKGHPMTGTRTLEPELLQRMDAYWRAANYLSVGQIYLYDNPLLRRAAEAVGTSSRWWSGTGAPRRGRISSTCT